VEFQLTTLRFPAHILTKLPTEIRRMTSNLRTKEIPKMILSKTMDLVSRLNYS
jgi:hypothetical protein